MDFAALQNLSFSFRDIISFGFFFAIALYAIYSAVLYYHWNTYATDNKVTRVTLLIYCAATLPLVIVMAIMLFFI